MTEELLLYEYVILRFVPSVLTDETIPVGILLQGFETAAGERNLRFARAKLVQQPDAHEIKDLEFSKTLIKAAVKEIQAVVERAHVSGQAGELDALLQQLLNANSALCAFGPYPCRPASSPESELDTLFERLLRQPS